MSLLEEPSSLIEAPAAAEAAIATAARAGLFAQPKTLPPWLFYDEAGSILFEQITELPEYYLTRTERALIKRHAEDILDVCGPVTIAELGAGTATKTGILLAAASAVQPSLLYQPIDVSPTALDEASACLLQNIPGLRIHPQVANYITDPIRIERAPHTSVLALYIGSSIGNFAPAEARAILSNLRAHLQPGDHLLLGTDLATGHTKSVASLLAAYDDTQGVTAAFNLNILTRLNRELGTDFDLEAEPARFLHRARWNAAESRIEMHLESTCFQAVRIPASSAGSPVTLHFAPGETIHTENSYKFTPQSLAALLAPTGFVTTRTFHDPDCLFAVTLATAI